MTLSKLLLTVSILSACLMSSAAYAERLIIEGSGLNKSVACTGNKTDIYGKNNTVTLTGKCGEIDIRGNGHTVTFEASEEIEVKGANNKITGGTAEEISVKGENNQITATLKSTHNDAELDVSGKANTAHVKLETHTEIDVRGRNNKITWSKGNNTSDPLIQNSGIENTVNIDK